MNDQYVLRRRVVITAFVSFLGFIAIAWTVAWLEVADAWLLIGMALFYLLVTRPMLKPARDAIKLRRRLAYHAYLEEREQRDR